jgi:hypothetical protein
MADRCYAEYDLCQVTQNRSLFGHYAECRYAECRFSECLYGECCGTCKIEYGSLL